VGGGDFAPCRTTLNLDSGGERKRHLEPVQSGLVLVVDDDEAARYLVVRALARKKISCIEAVNGESALERVLANPTAIEAIILDVMMPDMTGFDVMRALKKNPMASSIPVILVTASATEEEDIVRGVEYGAIDYLTKPYSPAVLVAKLRAACERARAERRLRYELRFAELHAMIDPLTGLFNRRHFDTRIHEATAYAKRHLEPFSIVMLDLDHFKLVNDTYGHEEGDRVLVDFAAAVRAVLRGDDVAFRYGGEEFVLLLRGCDSNRALDVASRLKKQLGRRPHHFADGSSRPVPFSAGVAAALEIEGFSGEELVSRADAALYRAKNAGRDRAEAW
jgi:two-component system, cell cycle response regulator